MYNRAPFAFKFYSLLCRFYRHLWSINLQDEILKLIGMFGITTLKKGSSHWELPFLSFYRYLRSWKQGFSKIEKPNKTVDDCRDHNASHKLFKVAAVGKEGGNQIDTKCH